MSEQTVQATQVPSTTAAPSVHTHSVVVTNISEKANEKTVSDFFSFCGRISKLVLRSDDHGHQTAVVHFETEEAARTALLLTNALIVDTPITVKAGDASIETHDEKTKTFEGSKLSQQAAPTDASRSSIISSILSAGYKLGADVLQAAKDFDAKHGISSTISSGAEAIKHKVDEIDKQFKVSETASAIKNTAVDTVHAVDQKLGVSETFHAAKNTAAETVHAVDQKLGVSETLHAAKNTAAETLQSAKNTTAETLQSAKNTTAETLQSAKNTAAETLQSAKNTAQLKTLQLKPSTLFTQSIKN
eukprot:TRINITY_DN116_c0_g1_i2.p1 TRINITY_DN116_c0_g1~~TRINITY_DN116_c0_g1_i2.p1  ORF type:complete len:303 (+),score=73.24 TRINITY_DN116_c0_g1_i2:47-955(+)